MTIQKQYESTLEFSRKVYNERYDCAVRTVCILTDLPYAFVHHLFEKRGRCPRQSTPNRITRRVIEDCGFGLSSYPHQSKTIRSISQELPLRGRFLIWVKGHVLPVRSGLVLDWSADRLHRVRSCEQLLRVRSVRQKVRRYFVRIRDQHLGQERLIRLNNYRSRKPTLKQLRKQRATIDNLGLSVQNIYSYLYQD